MNVKLPVICPSCSSQLLVRRLACEVCQTEVSGQYKLPVHLLLDAEEQEFMVQFLMFSGSLKEMAAHLGKSYPTVRNKLDDLILKIKTLEHEA